MGTRARQGTVTRKRTSGIQVFNSAVFLMFCEAEQNVTPAQAETAHCPVTPCDQDAFILLARDARAKLGCFSGTQPGAEICFSQRPTFQCMQAATSFLMHGLGVASSVVR